MRQHGQKQVEEATIDLTPMLDVVFIMLIFFIVTATFVKQAGVQVTKADAETAVLAKSASMIIAIDEKNNVYIDRQRYGVDAVRAVVERLIAENPKGTVVIEPDAKSDITVYARVQDQVKAAGAANIVMATNVED